MKHVFGLLILLCCIVFGPIAANAGHAHYCLGVEGIKGASLPPPGWYYKAYFTSITADHQRSPDDHKDKKFDLNAFSLAHRIIKVWDHQFLGGDLVSDVIIPMVYTDVSYQGAFKDHKFGFGDIHLEPFLLAWHGARWDAVVGPSVFIPVGYSNSDRPASPGKNFWTIQMAVGGTYYFDAAKTWSLSAVARYEVHTRESRSKTTRGDDFHIEWGAGKLLENGLELGVAGYMAWQPTKDRGDGSSDERYQAYALGPEVQYTYAPWGMAFSLRSLMEFGVRNGSEGNVSTLSITKFF